MFLAITIVLSDYLVSVVILHLARHCQTRRLATLGTEMALSAFQVG